MSCFAFSCKENINNKFNTNNFDESTKKTIPSVVPIISGADRLQLYLPDLKDKNIGLVVNHTSRVGNHHLVDTLLSFDLKVHRIFSPEHGFKGEADAGEKVENGLYKSIPVVSLYGKNRRPTKEQIADLDVVVFDIQDVGVRFYTYISTLSYVMEEAAKNNVQVIVLDRPNPNGYYVDGPLLEKEYQSFVGLHKVPVVYGMTIGEYAQMVAGEGWLGVNNNLNLKVVPCKNYDHTMTYDLPVKPSPNLPNLKSILLYPTLCYFEGTTLSIGRGTSSQFQIIGHPSLINNNYSFIPKPNDGASNPKLNGKTCFGINLATMSRQEIMNKKEIDFSYLFDFYRQMKDKDEAFFINNNFFEKLIGTESLRDALNNNVSIAEWKNSWKDDLSMFKKIRKNYLLYADFE